jgi:predicted nucleotidyltransferase
MAIESQGTSPVLAGSDLRAAIKEIVSRHLNLSRYHLFLFGSESAGTTMRGSDIDIGILGDGPVPGRIMERIRSDLETLRTLRRFDVVDFFGIGENFRSAALRNAERL